MTLLRPGRPAAVAASVCPARAAASSLAFSAVVRPSSAAASASCSWAQQFTAKVCGHMASTHEVASPRAEYRLPTRVHALAWHPCRRRIAGLVLRAVAAGACALYIFRGSRQCLRTAGTGSTCRMPPASGYRCASLASRRGCGHRTRLCSCLAKQVHPCFIR